MLFRFALFATLFSSTTAYACLCDAGIGEIIPANGAVGVPLDTRMLAVGSTTLTDVRLTSANGVVVDLTDEGLSWTSTGFCGYGTDHRYVPNTLLEPNTEYTFEVTDDGTIRRSVFTTSAVTTAQAGPVGIGFTHVGVQSTPAPSDISTYCGDDTIVREVEFCIDAPVDALGRLRLVRTDPLGLERQVWGIVPVSTTSMTVRVDVQSPLDCFYAELEDGAGQLTASQVVCMDVDPLVAPGDCSAPVVADTGDTGAAGMTDTSIPGDTGVSGPESQPDAMADPEPTAKDEEGGCGCQSSPSPLWLALFGLGAIRRRQE